LSGSKTETIRRGLAAPKEIFKEEIMKEKTKLLFAFFAVLLFCVFAGCGGTSSTAAASGSAEAKPLVLKLGTAHADGQPTVEACKKFGEDVQAKTNGRITVEVFPGGILGNETSMRDSVATGSIQMASLGAGVMGAYTGAANLPVANYVWRDEAHMLRVLNGELGKKYIYDPVETVAGIHVINGWPQPARRLLTLKPVRNLAELKGMKIRVPAGNSLYEDTWMALGTLPVALPMDEVYSALEQGVIDGLEMPTDSLYYNGYHEKAKYLALTDHMMYLQYLFINASLWNSLSPEDRKTIEDCAVDAEKYHNKLRDDSLNTILKDMQAKGVTVSAVDIASFKAACDPVLQKWMNTWGQEVYDAFTK
jgi:tripartite ATP-independent transporter DctP family solute receptor